MLVSILFCLWVQDPYVLILKNEQRLEVQAEPNCDTKRCVVVLMNGQKTSLPAGLIDQPKTERINAQLAEARQAEADARAAETAKAAKTEKEKKEKYIAVKSTRKLPRYERDQNQVTGGSSNESASEALGPPVVYTYDNDDPVYLMEEKRQRFEDHYIITCKIKVNAPAGARDITVGMKVNFTDSAPQSMEQDIQGQFNYNDVSTVRFRVPSEDEILQTSFTISAATI